MGTKFQRPAGAYAGASGLANRTKYQDDASATPKRAISSAKVDGDVNYILDALNTFDDTRGTLNSLADRLNVSLNNDGTLKVSVAGALDEFVVHTGAGTLARVDNSTFTLAGGDFTGIYTVNRRVRLTVAGVLLVGDVASVSFGSGLTTVGCVDLVQPDNNPGTISVAPSQVAYGPLTTGTRGNTPRRVETLTIPAGTGAYQLGPDVNDLVVRRNGSIVARVASGGVSGLAAGSVGLSQLASPLPDRLLPAGMLAPFAGSSAPSGWLLCDGAAVSRTTYAALFAVLGSTYGAGDGTTTFNVPDLRGRVPFGLDNMGGTAASRVTSGVSGINGTTLGASGGNQALHGHTHTASVTDPGHAHSIQLIAQATTAGNFVPQTTSTPLGGVATTNSATTGISVTNTSTGAGNSQNMPPALMVNWLVKI